MVPLGKRSDRRYKILGADIAGRVESVGKDVKRFKPGDEVFGDLSNSGWGGFAEYVRAREGSLALKPPNMTFEVAATIPQAGQMAIQGIRDKGDVQPGHRVLINGAGGGVGMFAVQMAKTKGAQVTGVDSTGKLDYLRSIGADHVIDYTQEDFTKSGKRYDLILDVKANRSIFAYRRALRPGGKFVMVGGTWSHVLQLIFIGPLINLIGSKKFAILILRQNKDLASLIELVENGKVVPVIDRLYPLDEVSEAIQCLADGQVRGKVVITMDHSSGT
jgi:NADPH:quinone reductase-like Zn-dependent oxidoreductase